MNTTTISASDTLDRIAVASDDELDAFFAAIKNRRTALLAQRALTVQIGTKVRLTDLSPRYLNGLTGTVSEFRSGRKYVTVMLDEDSTQRLRIEGRRKYHVTPEQTEWPLGGIPTGCCIAE